MKTAFSALMQNGFVARSATKNRIFSSQELVIYAEEANNLKFLQRFALSCCTHSYISMFSLFESLK